MLRFGGFPRDGRRRRLWGPTGSIAYAHNANAGAAAPPRAGSSWKAAKSDRIRYGGLPLGIPPVLRPFCAFHMRFVAPA
jgi:hypothetical protein